MKTQISTHDWSGKPLNQYLEGPGLSTISEVCPTSYKEFEKQLHLIVCIPNIRCDCDENNGDKNISKFQ